MAKQRGMRPIIEDTFHTLWWVPDDMPPYVLTKVMRQVERWGLDQHLKELANLIASAGA
jgi:hypothetical protein